MTKPADRDIDRSGSRIGASPQVDNFFGLCNRRSWRRDSDVGLQGLDSPVQDDHAGWLRGEEDPQASWIIVKAISVHTMIAFA